MSQCVLAIDDSPDVHRLLDVRLRPEGLVLHHALDAERGLSMAAELRPDLVPLAAPYTYTFLAKGITGLTPVQP